MKFKKETTAKNIRQWYSKHWRVGYCDLQTIFNGVTPDYYTAGVYGWNFDAYESPDGDTVITTGYRNMIGERIPSELLEKYNKKASKINAKYSAWVDYEKRQKALEKMRLAFWAELETM